MRGSSAQGVDFPDLSGLRVCFIYSASGNLWRKLVEGEQAPTIGQILRVKLHCALVRRLALSRPIQFRKKIRFLSSQTEGVAQSILNTSVIGKELNRLLQVRQSLR